MSNGRPIRSPRRQNLSVGTFCYECLSPAVQTEIRAEAIAIRELVTKTAENVVNIGLRLQSARDRIGRQHFQEWLRTEFHWSQPVASNYMRVARAFGALDCLAQFQPGALYILARKKAGPHARESALSLARQGQFITTSRAQSLIKMEDTSEAPTNRRLIKRLRLCIQKLIHEVAGEDKDAVAAELQELLRVLKNQAEESASDTSTPS